MTLKTATNIAIVGIVVNLLVAFLQRAAIEFDLIDYTKHLGLIQAIGYIQLLALNVPLIIFFIVLRSKQR